MRSASDPRLALVIVATSLIVGPRLASAEATNITRVHIAPSTCPESLVTREVNAALRIELTAMGMIGTLCSTDDSCEPTDGVAVVGVELEGCELREGPVLVWVESTSLQRSERWVPLDDIMMPARVRAVALSAAELLRAHQTWEREPDGDPAGPREPRPPSDETIADFSSDPVFERSADEPSEDDGEAPSEEDDPEIPEAVAENPTEAEAEADSDTAPLQPESSPHTTMERRFSRAFWGVALTGTGFSHGGPAHIGVRGGVAIHLGSRGPFWMLIDLGLMYGGKADDLGRIDALTATAATTFAYGVQLGRALLLLGPGAELGWTHGFGRSDRVGVSSANQGSLVSMILAEVRVVVRLRRRSSLSLGLDAGAVLTTVDLMSAGRSLVTIDGAVFRGLLGFCFE